MSRLCPDCAACYDGWRLYGLIGPIPRWRQDSPNGKNVELYKERSIEMWRKYREERKALADWQCEFIRDLCAREHQAPEQAAA
ncbi:hypothetical protein [Nocardia flavorosea]|uniref:Uncharacterized protein n=1 Tax=Nocardia flavorosea TaxID=53429 RepID=A0A846YSF5_9NOCA|nr:hypothetical protein [Nocardia flavorosea]NKY60414.1 hypothetical protein [Nocardia flavorosea]